MCGIAGGPSFNKAFRLYEANLRRGYFSSGFLAFDGKDNLFVAKQKEVFDYDKLRSEMYQNLTEPIYCLFHSRAPTNSTKPFDVNSTHPFNFGMYYVAHNGIITNFRSFPESAEFDVDSSIIPFHLHDSQGDIVATFERYEGLLTCWIYDAEAQQLNVVKAGSSLHVSEDSFSSISFEDSKPVNDDGIIFTFTGTKLIENDKFVYDNPYDL